MRQFVNHIGKLLAAPFELSGRLLLAVSLSATVLTALLMYFIGPLLLTGVQRYNDIVVGEVTLADVYKHGEIVASFAAVILYFIVWWLAALLAARLSSVPEEAGPQSESCLPWLPCLFISYFAGTLIISKNVASTEIGISVLLVVVYSLHLKFYGKQGDPGRIAFAMLAGVVTAGGIFFSVAGCGVAMRFFFPQAIPSWYPAQLPLYAGGVGLLSTLFLARLSERLQLRVAHAAQLLTPLLLLAAFTRVYQSADGMTQNLAPLSTKCLAVALTLAVLVVNVRFFFRKAISVNAQPRDLLLLVSVVVVTAYAGPYGQPPFLSTDMFHAGESLLGWQQVFEKGQFPFSGFAVARGFVDAVPGMVNSLLFDGTFATSTFAPIVYAVGLAMLNSLLLCTLVGAGWAMVLWIPACIGGTFLTVLLLLVQPKLLTRPLLWLFVWVLICPLYCLYHTTFGIALTAGTIPVAAWAVYAVVKGRHLAEAWHSNRRRLLAGAALAAAVLCLLSPLVFSWASYVMEQGKINEIAHGTSLFREMISPTWFRWQSRLAWEMFRVGGWLLGIILLWHLYVRERGERLPVTGATFLGSVDILALTGIVSTIAYIPYSMGRIDDKVLSRTGLASIIILTILLPLVLILKKKGRRVPALFVAVFLIGVGHSAFYTPLAAISEKSVQVVKVPSGARWFEGQTISPLFGNTFVDGETVAKAMALKGVTDKVIFPGESYLDLTNNIGYYFLLDYKVPSVYAGYYTVASEETQNRVINALQKNPPPLVWAGPARTFNSGTASLRSYRLYRWLLQKGYVPLAANGMQFLVREDRYKTLFPVLPPLELQAQELTATFNNEYLGGIPVAWGRNMDRLARRFRRGTIGLTQTAVTQGAFQASRDNTTVPVVTVELASSEPIRGGEYDFMLLRFAGASGPVQVKASWSESENPFAEWRSVVFAAQSGSPLLIPLGSHPDWLMSRNIGKMKFDIIGMERAGDLVLEPPVFLSLIK